MKGKVLRWEVECGGGVVEVGVCCLGKNVWEGEGVDRGLTGGIY